MTTLIELNNKNVKLLHVNPKSVTVTLDNNIHNVFFISTANYNTLLMSGTIKGEIVEMFNQKTHQNTKWFAALRVF